jgi:hypothetical protein
MSGERVDVQVVTICDGGRSLVVAPGRVVHQIGNERFLQPQSVQGVHTSDAEDPLDRRYGHVVHT